MEKIIFGLLLPLLFAACQARPVAKDTDPAANARRDPAALTPHTWRSFDYNHPEKSAFFREAIYREEELARRAQLVNACGLTADWNRLEGVEQSLLFIRLRTWPREKLRASQPWLTDPALDCLRRAPNI